MGWGLVALGAGRVHPLRKHFEVRDRVTNSVWNVAIEPNCPLKRVGGIRPCESNQAICEGDGEKGHTGDGETTV